MSEKHTDSFSLIWLDADVEENQQTDQKLCSIGKNFQKFNQINQCQEYLAQTSYTDRIILIVSGQLGRQIVPLINELQQIISIYVYCMNKQGNQQWSSEYRKVRGIAVTLEELVHQISIEHRKYQELDEPLSMNIYQSSSGQSTVDLNGQFVFSQILMNCLLRLQSNNDDKEELLDFCRNQYKHNSTELLRLQEFETEYKPEKVLWWYTRDSFFYRILNEALRTQDTHLIFLFRSFIYDLLQELKRNQLKEVLDLYRVQIISHEELNKLTESSDRIISINSFFSTSRSAEYAKFFLGGSSASDNRPRVFFKIHADPDLVKSKPFADIHQFSNFDEEYEVLFMAGSIFRLKEILLDKEQIWNISMDLCSDEDHEMKDVLSHMTEKTGYGPTDLHKLGKIVQDMGKPDLAVKYFTRLCDELPPNDPLLEDLYDNIAKAESQKQNLNESVKWHKKLLGFKERNRTKNSIEVTHEGSLYGNLDGGKSFDDADDLKLPALTSCVGIEVFWNVYLSTVRFIYDKNDATYSKLYRGNDQHAPEGRQRLRKEKFMLDYDERFDCVTLYVGDGKKHGECLTVDGKYISFVTGIQFHTTAGRTTCLYGVKDERVFTESFQDYILGYVKGRCGLVIDELQFIWYRQNSFDNMWMEINDGRIPSNGFVAGQKNNKRFYIGRFKTKKGKMFVSKLIEGSKTAEEMHLDVLTASPYQILINPDKKGEFQWRTIVAGSVSQGAFRITNDQETNHYVGRVTTASGAIFLGHWNADMTTFYCIDEGQEKDLAGRFEVLCFS